MSDFPTDGTFRFHRPDARTCPPNCRRCRAVAMWDADRRLQANREAAFYADWLRVQEDIQERVQEARRAAQELDQLDQEARRAAQELDQLDQELRRAAQERDQELRRAAKERDEETRRMAYWQHRQHLVDGIGRHYQRGLAAVEGADTLRPVINPRTGMHEQDLTVDGRPEPPLGSAGLPPRPAMPYPDAPGPYMGTNGQALYNPGLSRF